jgi:heterogeneous nuclear ribonucleoprotein U-like protein 1
MGVAFKVSRKELNEYVQSAYSKTQFIFFPHVLTKNVVFETNFGQRVSLIGDEPFAPIKADFQLIQKLPLELRVHNERKSKSKADCEVIFLIGLPGVGKTKYAQDLTRKNPQKFFYTIGVSAIIDKMKVIAIQFIQYINKM